MPNQTARAATKYLDENYPTTMYDEQTIISAGKDFMAGYDEACSTLESLLSAEKKKVEKLEAENKRLALLADESLTDHEKETLEMFLEHLRNEKIECNKSKGTFNISQNGSKMEG